MQSNPKLLNTKLVLDQNNKQRTNRTSWVSFSVFLGDILAGVLAFVDSFPVSLELLVPSLELLEPSLVDPLLQHEPGGAHCWHAP